MITTASRSHRSPSPISQRSDREARRDFIKTHHPDRGGDPAYFAAELARLDGQSNAAYGDTVHITIHRRRGIVRLLASAARNRIPGQSKPPRVR